jgi:PAS domain S-box-containing protein
MKHKIDKNSISVPKNMLEKWQTVVNILAEVIHVPAALIMRTEQPYIEVLRSSHSVNNPYKVGDRERLAGLYCEHVIRTKNKLLVPDARRDKKWAVNPDIKLGMVSYLGFPLIWPDGEAFGTLCALDLKENRYSETYEQLMLQFKELIESHLALLYERASLIVLAKVQQSELINVKDQFHNASVEYNNLESQLKENDIAYHELFESIADAAMLFDAQTRRFVDVNQYALDLYGYTKQEFLELKHQDITAELEESEVSIRETLKNKLKYIPLRFHRKKDGTVFPVEISGSSFTVHGREMLCGIVRDITMQKKLEEKLSKSESTYRLLCDHIPGMVYSAIPDWATKVINQSEMLCGYSPEEFNSQKINWLDIIHPDDKEKVLQESSPLLKKQKSIVQEYRIISKDGRIRWVEDHKTSRFEKNCFVGVDGVVFDITEHELVKTRLDNYKDKVLQAQKQAYVNSIGSVVAHQINQPLTKINILLDRAIEQIEETSCSPSALKNVKEGLAEVTKAVSIIHRFRQYSKDSALESSGKISVSSIADRIVSMLAQKAMQIKMHISIINLSSLPEVEINETALEQIFLIIVENAIEAADGKKDHKLEITGKSADGNIELQFTDDCCGIASENLDKIFEPFFSAKDMGMGLGLDIVQRILIAHGGAIRVESQLGKGTTFFVTLPISNILK